jgi:pimeloyl-ACP methyl ester carboxylesterase
MKKTLFSRSIIAACTWAACAAATQVANFNVSKAEAEAHNCGTECQRRLTLTIPADIEAMGGDFDSEFFATASNFSQATATPGEVLKLQPVDPKTLDIDGGATTFRFQYTTVDFDGSLVPATGFIAFPFTPHISFETEDFGRYRLAAFAHGTSGIFQGCAPSNGPHLYDYGTWQQALQRGYAIVATDYAGLGNNYTTHKYLSAPAQANDVYYSVLAARKLFNESLTADWVSFGHSQGGGAVWKLAESKHVRDDPSYMGTVAIAPSTYFIKQLVASAGSLSPSNTSSKAVGAGFLPLLPESARRVIPSYKESILSPILRNRTQLATKAQWCLEAVLGLSLDLDTDELVSLPGAVKDIPVLLEWERMVAPAQGDRSSAPILIIQGKNDSAVSWEVTEQAWKNSCHAGNELHLRLFPSQGHRPSLTAGAPEWLLWMDQLFEKAGKSKCQKTCTKYTREPFNLAYVRAPTDVDLKPYLG